jgi:two-component system NtrC family sensor kinase
MRIPLRTRLVLNVMTGLVFFALVFAWLPHRSLMAAVAVLAVTAVGTVAVTAWIAGSIAAPTARLTDAARRWAREEMGHRVVVRTGDEFQELGIELNRMADAVQHRAETVRLHTDERLAQAERLATVGRLAAGVAHEINNPLGSIQLYTDLLLEATAPDDPRRSNLSQIAIQARRAQEIVKGLLDFSRQRPPRLERRDLNGIVAEGLAWIARQADARNVTLRTELSTVPLWVRADASQIQQVLINIIVNALDAMREGGTLTVRSGYSERPGFCRIAVTDSGPGIPEEHLARLFDPFFTTKEVGRGVGLGLAISYGIVQQHGGEIEVQSALGAGSTFRVLLPVEADEA